MIPKGGIVALGLYCSARQTGKVQNITNLGGEGEGEFGLHIFFANLQVCNAAARSTQGSDSGGEGDACDDRLCHPIMNKRASFTTIAVDRPALSEGGGLRLIICCGL